MFIFLRLSFGREHELPPPPPAKSTRIGIELEPSGVSGRPLTGSLGQPVAGDHLPALIGPPSCYLEAPFILRARPLARPAEQLPLQLQLQLPLPLTQSIQHQSGRASARVCATQGRLQRLAGAAQMPLTHARSSLAVGGDYAKESVNLPLRLQRKRHWPQATTTPQWWPRRRRARAHPPPATPAPHRASLERAERGLGTGAPSRAHQMARTRASKREAAARSRGQRETR